MKSERITVGSREEAWKNAQEIFGCSYDLDPEKSKNAGYNIYTGNSDATCWISDLGNVLELNMSDGSVIRIHIETEEKLYTAAEVKRIVTEAKRDLDSTKRVIAVVKMLDITPVTDDVLDRMYRRQRELKNKLAEFGIEF